MSTETEMKFTPGPWSAHAILSASENHKGWRIFAATGYPVAEVYPLNTDPSPAACANKALITAAPALYEALREIYAVAGKNGWSVTCSHDECRNAMNAARAALALVDGPTKEGSQ